MTAQDFLCKAPRWSRIAISDSSARDPAPPFRVSPWIELFCRVLLPLPKSQKQMNGRTPAMTLQNVALKIFELGFVRFFVRLLVPEWPIEFEQRRRSLFHMA